MPRFLDLYIGKIREKRETILSLLSCSERTLKMYREIFYKYWRSLPNPIDVNAEIFAIDSSDDLIEIKGGVTVHVCRALALSNTGVELRELEIYPFYSVFDAETTIFRSRVREHLEHLLALKCIRAFNNSRKLKIIILDGSLYGRTAHLPKDLEIPGYQDFMLNYIEVYSRLFTEAKEKNVVLIGLSKDSKSRIYRRILLLKEMLRRIEESKIDSGLLSFVAELWEEIWRNPRTVLKRLNQSLGVPEWIKVIFEEALKPRPDAQIILALAKEAGYTLPALLKVPAPALGSFVRAIERDQLLEYISKSFQKSITEKNFGIYEKAMKILPRVLKYPDIVMLYLVPRRGDIPLRIDFPEWTLPSKIDLENMEIIENIEEDLSWIISMLVNMYAGPRHYNVLMEQVDAKVKFRLQDRINVYEPLLGKELDFLIEHTRDMRRVRYP